MLLRFVGHWLGLALGLYIISRLMPVGISFDRPEDLAWAALVLILANTFIKPVLVFISLPLVILSLGLFLLFINGLILYWLPHFVSGFHVANYTAAFFGALLLSFITYLFSAVEKQTIVRRRQRSPNAGRVIDI